MSKQRDPRFAETTRAPVASASPASAKAAAAAASARPAPPTADMEAPRTNGTGGKAKKRVPRKKISPLTTGDRPAGFKKLLLGLAGLALLYFVYSCVESVNDTLKQNQRNEAITTVWRQLLSSNTTISGTPTNLNESGSPSFPYIAFESSRTRAELHRNIRLATALPGIQAIGLSPESTAKLGGGVADDSTVMLVAANFENLDSLSLSATRVTTLETLSQTSIRELRLVNTPIKREKLAGLQFVPDVTDLWIGWELDPRNPDHEIFGSELYKKRLIDALVKMPNLQSLYVYNLAFNSEEMKKLNRLNIKTLNKK